jgi:hypothetical protein
MAISKEESSKLSTVFFFLFFVFQISCVAPKNGDQLKWDLAKYLVMRERKK